MNPLASICLDSYYVSRVQEKDVKIAVLDSKIKNSKHSSVYFSTLNSFSIVPNIGVFPK
jgi:hypothetical protein